MLWFFFFFLLLFIIIIIIINYYLLLFIIIIIYYYLLLLLFIIIIINTNCSDPHPVQKVPSRLSFCSSKTRGNQTRLTGKSGKRLKSDLPWRERNQEEYQRRQSLAIDWPSDLQ